VFEHTTALLPKMARHARINKQATKKLDVEVHNSCLQQENAQVYMSRIHDASAMKHERRTCTGTWPHSAYARCAQVFVALLFGSSSHL
jgi:hypothetical protein